jgi:hypothetical protein
MKKLLYIVFVLLFQITNAQILSVKPDKAKRGEYLSVTITLVPGAISLSSPPTLFADIYLTKGGVQTIFPSSFFAYPFNPPYTDSINANFQIPYTATPGYYDLHVFTGQYPTQVEHVLTNAFRIGDGLIEGNVYYDANQNGIQNLGEYGMSNISIIANPSGTATYSDIYGQYKIIKDTGTYSVECNYSG